MTDQKNPYITHERLTSEQARQSEGCWIDSSLGQYTGEKVIAAAVTFGFESDPDQSTTECEHYHEEWEAAENYLNAHTAPEGYFFGTSEAGDWGLWKDETDEESDEETETSTSTPRCDQCTSMTINGLYTHEHGCPNQHKEYSSDLEAWITPEPDEPDFEAALDDYEFDLGE